MAVKEGWRGRFFEDFEVGDVYEHPFLPVPVDLEAIPVGRQEREFWGSLIFARPLVADALGRSQPIVERQCPALDYGALPEYPDPIVEAEAILSISRFCYAS